jgi:sporulation protein YlmC with PRC-barrel domain
MPHFGILREYRFDDIQDVRGSEVYGVNDEKLGTIDDVVFDHSTGDIRYVVLKTGLLSKRVIVPANRIDSYGNHEDKFYADLDKERLEMLPEFKDNALKSQQDWSIYEKEYESRLNDGAILYNKDTGRIVTPPIEQVEGARRTPLTGEARQSLDRDFTPQRMGHEDDLMGVGGSASDKTILQPQKASIAGRENVVDKNARTREVMNPVGAEIEIPVEGRNARIDNAAIDAARIESARMEESRAMRINNERAAVRSSENLPPARPLREVDDTMGGEMEIPVEEEGTRINDNLREPGIYRVNQTDVNPSSNLNSRWSAFQDRLRSRRDKIIVDCPDCASQEKVA